MEPSQQPYEALALLSQLLRGETEAHKKGDSAVTHSEGGAEIYTQAGQSCDRETSPESIVA